ncbi:unnamed protein product [Cylicocyclus nassatus]|uniref:Uncharacterized protein n=1 Tax=Cylicocyclus nassatus TaxID=53992 RepID=A0AA36GH65_CYLNA|nr:unnamed protein product [Cylicocyclus nassatus]
MPLCYAVTDLYELGKEDCVPFGWIAEFGNTLIRLLKQRQKEDVTYDCKGADVAADLLKSGAPMPFFTRHSAGAFYYNESCGSPCELPEPIDLARNWTKNNEATVYTVGCAYKRKRYHHGGEYRVLIYCFLDFNKSLETYTEFKEEFEKMSASMQ